MGYTMVGVLPQYAVLPFGSPYGYTSYHWHTRMDDNDALLAYANRVLVRSGNEVLIFGHNMADYTPYMAIIWPIVPHIGHNMADYTLYMAIIWP